MTGFGQDPGGRGEHPVDEMPPELPDEDREAWARLGSEKRKKAWQRIGAIRAVQAGEGVMEAATQNGLGRRRLAQLLEAWKTQPSLKALGLYSENRGHRQAKVYGDTKQWVIDAATSYLRAGELRTTEKIVAAIMAAPPRGVPAPGAFMLRDYVKEARRQLSARTGAFGQSIAIDVSALEIFQAPGQPYVLCAVIDAGTTYIAGWSVGLLTDVAQLIVDAARDASRKLDQLIIGGPISNKLDNAIVDFAAGVVGQGGGIGILRILNLRRWKVNYQKRSIGTHILDALGRDLDRIKFRPAWVKDVPPPTTGSSAKQHLKLEEMQAIVDRALKNHNDTIVFERPKDASEDSLDMIKREIADRISEVSSILVG